MSAMHVAEYSMPPSRSPPATWWGARRPASPARSSGGGNYQRGDDDPGGGAAGYALYQSPRGRDLSRNHAVTTEMTERSIDSDAGAGAAPSQTKKVAARKHSTINDTLDSIFGSGRKKI